MSRNLLVFYQISSHNYQIDHTFPAYFPYPYKLKTHTMLTVGSNCAEAGIRPLADDTSLPSAWTFDNASYEDTIDVVSDPLSSMDSISPLVSLLTLCYRCSITKDNASPSKPVHEMHPPDRLSTLMNAMAQSPACRTHRHEEMHNSFIRLLSPVLSGMAGLSDFEEAVGAFSAPDDFRNFWTFQGRNLIRDVLQGDGGDRDTRGSELPFVDVFVRDPTCRIALTREGRRLLLVPGEAQAGDGILEVAVGGGIRHWTVRLKGSVKVNIGEAFSSDW